jgi:NhaA family Na+:H+ antiporter
MDPGLRRDDKKEENMNRLISFFSSEMGGGVLLFLAAVLAMIVANSSLAGAYDALLHSNFSLSLDDLTLSKPLHHWINDGLMVIFFLLVGMEIKRELMQGHLAGKGQALLPVIAAIGGVVLPAAIYTAFNLDNPQTQHGWAIASATDIAFAVGILALFGRRLPLALKVFLTAVAVIDDLMAILIIAFFYSGGLDTDNLLLALTAAAVLLAMNLANVRQLSFYLFIGVLMWLAVLESGVHATIAGVVLGLMIPLKFKNKDGESPLEECEHNLAPFVTYIVLPLFAFANSGIPLAGMSLSVLSEPLPLGLIAGLFFGKQLGIFGAAWLTIKSGLAKLPAGANWRTLYGVCIIGGIGFTMSLFIGTLAFNDPALQIETRVGVLTGSLLSGLFGYAFLRAALSKRAS